jgi:hypothetical protein
MKKLVRKYFTVLAVALPMVSNAGTLCGAGTVKALAEGYLGLDQTGILLQATSGSSIGILPYNVGSAARFDALSKALRSAFLAQAPVGIYSAVADCNKINEVRICNVDADCR